MWTYRGDEPTVVSWLDDIATAHEAHRRAARLTRRRHRLVGAVTAVFAVATAVVVIVDLLADLDPWVSVVAGSLAVATALLSLLHAFADDAGQTIAHQHAATEYAGLRRQLEQAILSERITDDRLAEIRASWTRLERSSPTLTPRTVRAVAARRSGATDEPAIAEPEPEPAPADMTPTDTSPADDQAADASEDRDEQELAAR
ncbi:SLATT domain-containing protein [Mumia flava]|uniref:SLATT domain-containing protein n=1 Tax=Mumia flava TaxID=1348852 RepID=UPI000C24B03E|nr:SLATT domain-containing protein [Mumia flava]